MRVGLAMCVAVSIAIGAAAAAPQAVAAAAALDYEFFKTKVQPIFLKKRDNHARCIQCHTEANNFVHLERLAPRRAPLESLAAEGAQLGPRVPRQLGEHASERPDALQDPGVLARAEPLPGVLRAPLRHPVVIGVAEERVVVQPRGTGAHAPQERHVGRVDEPQRRARLLSRLLDPALEGTAGLGSAKERLDGDPLVPGRIEGLGVEVVLRPLAADAMTESLEERHDFHPRSAFRHAP